MDDEEFLFDDYAGHEYHDAFDDDEEDNEEPLPENAGEQAKADLRNQGKRRGKGEIAGEDGKIGLAELPQVWERIRKTPQAKLINKKLYAKLMAAYGAGLLLYIVNFRKAVVMDTVGALLTLIDPQQNPVITFFPVYSFLDAFIKIEPTQKLLREGVKAVEA